MNLLEKINDKIIFQHKDWQNQIKNDENEKVVFTNGCFDILHRGHLTYLAKASTFGTKLIVGVNSDASVKMQDKGSERPVNNESDRAFQLAALSFVDCVVVFSEKTPYELIKIIEPDTLVKGGDYNPKQKNPNKKDYIIGEDIVRNKDGKIFSIPLVSGYSTTDLIEKLRPA